MQNEKKTRSPLWIRPSVNADVAGLYEQDNCRSPSEFIEKAVVFYCGYLRAESANVYLSKVLTTTMRGMLDSFENPVVDDLLRQLAGRLATHKGKKIYGYLNQPARNIVNAIVDELAGDERIAQLYSLWYDQREAVLATYRSDMPERIALSQNSEFKAIKNAIITEAAQLMPEQTQAAQPSEYQQAAPMNIAGEVALGSLRLLGQLSRLIESKGDEGHKQVQVESKLFAEIREHKRDMGLR